jgi:hypothetical protein
MVEISTFTIVWYIFSLNFDYFFDGSLKLILKENELAPPFLNKKTKGTVF